MAYKFAHGAEWLEWLAQQVGTKKWFVGFRMTSRTRDKGYEVCITPKRYNALEAEFLRLKAAA